MFVCMHVCRYVYTYGRKCVHIWMYVRLCVYVCTVATPRRRTWRKLVNALYSALSRLSGVRSGTTTPYPSLPGTDQRGPQKPRPFDSEGGMEMLHLRPEGPPCAPLSRSRGRHDAHRQYVRLEPASILPAGPTRKPYPQAYRYGWAGTTPTPSSTQGAWLP